MHKFRRALAEGSVHVPDSPILDSYEKKPASNGKLAQMQIPRQTARQNDHRNEERYPAIGETARLGLHGETHAVELVNFSSNGVQILTQLSLPIGATISLAFENCEEVECAVRWVRGDRVGLEFIAETQILAAAGVVEMIVKKIRGVLRACGDDSSTVVGSESRSNDKRHGLIWFGFITLDNQSCDVRLRNISRGGAMLHIESTLFVKKGKSALLNLGEAGEVQGTVVWSAGPEIGMKFDRPFEVGALASQFAVAASDFETGDVPAEPEPEEQTNFDDHDDLSPPRRNYSPKSVYEDVPEETGRLTLEEIYATLYPNGRPEEQPAAQDPSCAVPDEDEEHCDLPNTEAIS